MGNNLPFSRSPSKTLPHTGQAPACAGDSACLHVGVEVVQMAGEGRR